MNGLEVQKAYHTDRAAAIIIGYIAEQMKVSLKECLLSTKYYSILQDSSTDTSVSEQGFVYVIFLNNGWAVLQFLSIESPQVADTSDDLVDCVKNDFCIWTFYESCYT